MPGVWDRERLLLVTILPIAAVVMFALASGGERLECSSTSLFCGQRWMSLVYLALRTLYVGIINVCTVLGCKTYGALGMWTPCHTSPARVSRGWAVLCTGDNFYTRRGDALKANSKPTCFFVFVVGNVLCIQLFVRRV